MKKRTKLLPAFDGLLTAPGKVYRNLIPMTHLLLPVKQPILKVYMHAGAGIFNMHPR